MLCKMTTSPEIDWLVKQSKVQQLLLILAVFSTEFRTFQVHNA
jgi:hypothetical protein